jgi:hypothetical protein
VSDLTEPETLRARIPSQRAGTEACRHTRTERVMQLGRRRTYKGREVFTRIPALHPATVDKNSRRRSACRNDTWAGAFNCFSNGDYRGRFIRRTGSAGYGTTPGEQPYTSAFVSLHFHVGLLMWTYSHGFMASVHGAWEPRTNIQALARNRSDPSPHFRRPRSNASRTSGSRSLPKYMSSPHTNMVGGNLAFSRFPGHYANSFHAFSNASGLTGPSL